MKIGRKKSDGKEGRRRRKSWNSEGRVCCTRSLYTPPDRFWEDAMLSARASAGTSDPESDWTFTASGAVHTLDSACKPNANDPQIVSPTWRKGTSVEQHPRLSRARASPSCRSRRRGMQCVPGAPCVRTRIALPECGTVTQKDHERRQRRIRSYGVELG